MDNKLFNDIIKFEYVKSIIGSGYEEQVASLAIRDKVAYRAARKNMQIHSAIILKINNEFSGFFTFQVNHEVGEFCLLQSAMELDRKDKEIYKDMLKEIIKQNTFGYPMIMTVSTKHDLECPKVLEAVGFKTYLILSGFEYMVYGNFEQIRMKRLAHATMTNTWNSTKADWLKMKREWNEKIEQAGKKHNIKNPKFASRDGCWQGSNGMANIVLAKQTLEDDKVKDNKTKTLNGNASVLEKLNLTINTSISALDTDKQIEYRLNQYNLLKNYCNSVLRIVSCDFNKNNKEGEIRSIIQNELFKNKNIIDTVFRPLRNNYFVNNNIINIEKVKFINSKVWASVYNKNTHLGKCDKCPDMCGVKYAV